MEVRVWASGLRVYGLVRFGAWGLGGDEFPIL